MDVARQSRYVVARYAVGLRGTSGGHIAHLRLGDMNQDVVALNDLGGEVQPATRQLVVDMAAADVPHLIYDHRMADPTPRLCSVLEDRLGRRCLVQELLTLACAGMFP